jgi:hypothetical protein
VTVPLGCYAIRALTTKTMKAHFNTLESDVWQNFIDKDGQPVENQQTYRTSHCIGNYEKAFTLIVQRTKITGQVEIDLDDETSENEVTINGTSIAPLPLIMAVKQTAKLSTGTTSGLKTAKTESKN